MLTQTARYALNILGCLAGRVGTRTPGPEIARETGVPGNYLSKILNQLRKHGIVSAEKGWGGGFELRPESLGRPISDIVSIIEGSERNGGGCLFGLPHCNRDRPCPLHVYWEQIQLINQEMLFNVRVGDLRR